MKIDITSKQQTHYYCFGGFTIQSCISLPLNSPRKPTNLKADVFIEWGSVPDELKTIISKGALWESGHDEFIFWMQNVARYYIKSGQQVYIQPHPDSSERAIRNYLLGPVLGVLIHQQKKLPLHASSVSVGNESVAFSGMSGMGKSTLAGFLTKKRGYKLIADDISAVEYITNNYAVVYPGMPCIRLWEDAAETLQLKKEEYDRGIVKNKYHVPCPSGDSLQPVRLKSLYLLEDSRSSSGVTIEKLTGMRSVQAVQQATYRKKFIGGALRAREHFKYCAVIANQIDVFVLKRPTDLELIDATLDALEAHWRVL